MANNYTQFSAEIPCKDLEQIQWLENELARASDGCPACDFNRQADGVWIYSEDNADIEALVKVVCEFQQRYPTHEPWGFTWAYTCSKPRVDNFGGGGVVIYEGEAEWMDIRTWCGVRMLERAKEGEQ